MKTIEIESLHSLVCHPIQILNHFHYWSKSTPTFNTWFFQFWLNARFFPNPMFPIPAEKEADSWMVAHTKTTAIKTPRRFICKIVRFSSLTFDSKETTLVSCVWMRSERDCLRHVRFGQIRWAEISFIVYTSSFDKNCIIFRL